MVHDLRNEVILSCLKLQLQFGQTAAEPCLVDIPFINLSLHLIDERCEGSQQLLVAARGMEVEMEVVAVDDGARRVAVRKHVEHHIVRPQLLRAVGDGDIGEEALRLIELVEVGGDIHLSAYRHRHRLVDDMQSPEVDLREVCRERGSTAAAPAYAEGGDESVEAELALDVTVAAVGLGDEMAAGEVRREVDIVEVILIVAERLDFCHGMHLRAGREEVGAGAARRYRSRERMDGLALEEVGYRQTARFEVGAVSHTFQVEGYVAADGATALRGDETGSYLLAVQFHVAAEGDASWDIYRRSDALRQQRVDKREIPRAGIDVHVGTQCLRHRDIIEEAAGIELENAGHGEIHIINMQLVEVTTDASIDDERHTRPDVKDVLWQVRRGKGEQVVRTYRSAHDSGEGSRTVGRQIRGEGVHVHAECEGEIREWCL